MAETNADDSMGVVAEVSIRGDDDNDVSLVRPMFAWELK